MNIALVVAGFITILIGVIHSVLGEILIFSRMRDGTFVPKLGKPLLQEKHVRILWATWHLVTIFGFGFAAVLFQAANQEDFGNISAHLLNTIALVMLASSLLVFFATKGMHPGWMGLLVVALLIWLV